MQVSVLFVIAQLTNIYHRSLRPVISEHLECPGILVSGAGSSDGLYKIAGDRRVIWAPGRQVYERIQGNRY